MAVRACTITKKSSSLYSNINNSQWWNTGSQTLSGKARVKYRLARQLLRDWWTTCVFSLLSNSPVTQSAFASTSDRLLCFPGACVGLIGPHPSDYAHALSACYFLQAVFLPALGLWSFPPALFFGFFLSTERIDESYIKAPTATSNCRLTISENVWAFFGR